MCRRTGEDSASCTVAADLRDDQVDALGGEPLSLWVQKKASRENALRLSVGKTADSKVASWRYCVFGQAAWGFSPCTGLGVPPIKKSTWHSRAVLNTRGI